MKRITISNAIMQTNHIKLIRKLPKSVVIVRLATIIFSLLVLLLIVSFLPGNPLPKNYQECKKSGQYTQLNELYCDYITYHSIIRSLECFLRGGEMIGIGPSSCVARYYNPNFVFPNNFQQCLDKSKNVREITSSKIEAVGQEYGGICGIRLMEKGNFSFSVVENLLQECQKNGGRLIPSTKFFPFTNKEWECQFTFIKK